MSTAKTKRSTKKTASKEELFERLKQAAALDSNIVFEKDAAIAMGIGISTYYTKFNEDERKQVDEILEVNRTKLKKTIREKLSDKATPAALIALYKLIGTQEERLALNTTAIEQADKNEHEEKITLTLG